MQANFCLNGLSPMPAAAPVKKLSFKQQQLLLREDAILDSVNRMLAVKGYDLMTMDEVAADVGISKASLYKHFASKDALAAASMTRLLDRTLAVIAALPESLGPVDRLKEVVRWAVRTHLDDEMPLLPSTRSTIQQALITHTPYLERLSQVTETLGGWILAAQESGELSSDLPGEVILYTIYARSCDPVGNFLKMGGAFQPDEIVEYLITTTFNGLAAR
ncbi:Intercellular adhesion protein R [Achromobacter kerstersii]|jgi:AcrR family transcriptional regulator|uniref:HTH tetR-type domain-containing protein n=2 Tax=Alcaligenaceae TaxID=506 RepID=A0A6S7BCQ4_9BURK|nr:hypothetical protein LMG3441_02964 [Achromobacter kerstersii]CUI89821.1 Intercellular adhesion protein R [Achromobacter kerstersii]